MPALHETFSTYKERIEKVRNLLNDPIVLSTNVPMPTLTGRDERIKMVPIGWPLFENKEPMFYIVTVLPDTTVHKHAHDEDIFRLVLKGSLVLNEHIEVNEGMWFVVRANTPYEITTKTGYTNLINYNHVCTTVGPLP
jgi:hypothetical protein